MKFHVPKLIFIAVLLPLSAGVLSAQELEPRALTNVPAGTNFAAGVYSYVQGNIVLDPAVPIEGLDAQIHTVVPAFLRVFSFFGHSAKIDAVVPFASGTWSGQYEQNDSTRSITGFGDPRIRVSFNFYGAPALNKDGFKEYQQKVVAGAIIQVISPLGQYDPTRLINLGSNRWTIKSQLGVSLTFEKWIVEGYLGAWFFTDNNNFRQGLHLSQRPLITLKTHLIRTFKSGRWLALDLGYGRGGRTSIEGELRDTRISVFRFGLTFAVPLSSQHTLRGTVVSGSRLERGPDFDAVVVSYQYRWGGNP